MPFPKELQNKDAGDLVEMINRSHDQKIMRVFVKISDNLEKSFSELKSSIDKSAVSSEKHAESNKKLSAVILGLDIVFGVATLIGLYIVIFK